MRYIINENNYVTAITFGAGIVYNDCACVEYAGAVPYGWDTLDDWYFDEGDKLWRWKIVGGNLEMDPTATAPKERSLSEPLLQVKSVSPAGYTRYVYPDKDYDGLSEVIVWPADLQSKEVALTGGEQTITPDDGYIGMDRVVIGAMKSEFGTVYADNSSWIELPGTGITNFTAVLLTRNNKSTPDKTGISVIYEVCAAIISATSVAISGFFQTRTDSGAVYEDGVLNYGGSLNAYGITYGNRGVRINGTGAMSAPFRFDGYYSYTVFGY